MKNTNSQCIEQISDLFRQLQNQIKILKVSDQNIRKQLVNLQVPTDEMKKILKLFKYKSWDQYMKWIN